MYITFEDIVVYIKEPYLSRGKGYFKDGLVELFYISSNNVKARVAGTQIYSVILSRKNKLIEGTCSCVAFSDYGPCKHLAATAFAVLQYNRDGYKPSEEYYDRIQIYDKLKKHLSSLSKQDLISLIMKLAQEYPGTIEYELEIE